MGWCTLQVNASLAARVMAAQGDEPNQAAAAGDAAADAPGKRSKRPASDLLQDERFAALFEDRAFAIDERSEEYKALHPNAGARPDEPSCIVLPAAGRRAAAVCLLSGLCCATPSCGCVAGDPGP